MMEPVKYHVTASGNSSLRGLFSSDHVDFDAPSNSLRANVTKAKAKYVYNLADGATGDSEEDEIRNVLQHSDNSYELIRLVAVLGGWSGMDDELPEGHLDTIATQIAQVLDQRDYVVYQLVRRYIFVLDYDRSATLGDCIARLLAWPPEFQAREFDSILGLKDPLLRGIANAVLRNRTNMIAAATVPPVLANQVEQTAPHRRGEVAALMYEAFYTVQVCYSLERLQYRSLYTILTDLVDPALSTIRRTACKSTFEHLALEFAAAEKAVQVAGSNEAKAIVNRFMITLQVALVNFPATTPAPGVIATIAAAIDSIAGDVDSLRVAVVNLPDTIAGIINVSALLGTDDDDKAREFASQLASQGTLAHVAFEVKDQAIKAMLNGSTGDDDELGVLKILKAAKAYNQAELYQLAASATWELLFSSFDGDEYDELENTLSQPF